MRILGILIALGILISSLSWAIDNILGVIGLALAAWGVYEWNKNKKLGAVSKVPGVIVAAGLCLSLGWFGFANDGNSITSVVTSKQQKDSSSQVQLASITGTNQQDTTPVGQKVKSPISLLAGAVTRVVDGDTIHVNIDGKEETVRLIGIDTPETHHPNKPVQPYGPEAEQFTRSQLDGKQVWLEKDVQER